MNGSHGSHDISIQKSVSHMSTTTQPLELKVPPDTGPVLLPTITTHTAVMFGKNTYLFRITKYYYK